MTQREKRMAILAGVMVIALLGRGVARRIAELTDSRERTLAALRQNIADRQLDVARGEKAARRLAAWQRRSLPTDRDAAVGAYAQWLHDRLDECGLSSVNVTSRAGVAAQGAPQLLTFTIDGEGDLRQLTEFLFAFYRAGHLHKIRSLRLSPSGNGSGPRGQGGEGAPRLLDIHLVIEAMILPGADRSDRLTQLAGNRLRWPEAKPYVAMMVARNVFEGPQPKVPQADTTADATPDEADRDRVAKQIVVTALFGNGSASQVWLNVRATDRILKLAPGDPFRVEGIEGTVTAIAAEKREVVITTGGRQLSVRLGETLADGKPHGEKPG